MSEDLDKNVEEKEGVDILAILLGIVLPIIFLSIILMSDDSPSKTDSFDWSDPEDVGGFMKWLDDNDKRDFEGYKID